MTKTAALSLAFVLAFTVGTPALAQDATAVSPPGATTGLPFVNDGANQPVLVPITPGAAPIEAPAAVNADVAEDAAEHVTEGAEGEAHAKKGLPQFDLSTFPRQLVWLTLTFVFMYIVFAKKTLPTIGRALETREQRIAGDLGAAEALKADVERVKGEYEAAIAKAQAEAQSLAAGLQADMKRTLESQDAAFKAKAEEAVSQLEGRIDANRGRVVAELNGMAAELAADISTRVTGVKADMAAARDAIDAETGNMKAA